MRSTSPYLVILVVALLVGFVVCGESVESPPKLKPVSIPGATVAFYEIVGSTAQELRAQLDAKGPIDGTVACDAITHWKLLWNWPGYGTKQADLAKATVTVRAIVIMPIWHPPANASPALVSTWDAFIKNLAEHEARHVANAESLRPVLERAIRKAGTAAEAEKIGSAALEKSRAWDVEFDRTSDHGKKDGARFP